MLCFPGFAFAYQKGQSASISMRRIIFRRLSNLLTPALSSPNLLSSSFGKVLSQQRKKTIWLTVCPAFSLLYQNTDRQEQKMKDMTMAILG
jgi:hypothetical protein